MNIYKMTLNHGLKLEWIENGPSPNEKSQCFKVKIREEGEDLIHEAIHILPKYCK